MMRLRQHQRLGSSSLQDIFGRNYGFKHEPLVHYSTSVLSLGSIVRSSKAFGRILLERSEGPFLAICPTKTSSATIEVCTTKTCLVNATSCKPESAG